jgi:hypothetical protein
MLLPACAHWNNSESGLQLPAPKFRSDSLVCEIAFVQWDTHQTDSDQRLWQAIDEQFLSTDVRRRLAENGLRIGLISGQLPEEIRSKLGSTGDPAAALTAEKLEPGTDMLTRRETRQIRAGVSEIIEVLPESPQSRVVLFKDQEAVRAERFDRPRGFMELESTTPGDGYVHVQLTPGIDFGEWGQRVVGNQGGLRYDYRRDQRLFAELAVAAQISTGQILVITSTPDAKGLGAAFFANRFLSGTEQLFLLIRLSRGQSDDLFTAADKLEPLITQQPE